MRTTMTLVLLAAGTLPLLAVEKLKSADERYKLFQQYVNKEAAEMTETQFEGVNSLADWKAQREPVRKRYMNALGLDPLPPQTPLNARITGTLERDSYRVEKIVFEAMPKLYVTGNLYLPKTKAPYPAVVYVTGHSPGPIGSKVKYQAHGTGFARNGFAAFVLDTVEFAEIPGIHHGTHNLGMWEWLSLGYSPAATEVWIAMRALDYLQGRSDIDGQRIAITGRSGGGAVSWFAAAADDRFVAAVPVHGTWNVESHVADDVVKENCDCIYFCNAAHLDLALVGALIAPRPLLIINGMRDVTFPPRGYKDVLKRISKIYEMYGVPEKVAEFELDTGHRDLPPYRKSAFDWIERWVGNGKETVDPDPDTIPDEQLAVLDKIPTDAINEHVEKELIHTAKLEIPATRAAWNDRRATLLKRITSIVSPVSGTVPFDTVKRPETFWTDRYAEAHQVEFTTDPGVRVEAQLYLPKQAGKSYPALIYVKGKEDIVYPIDFDLLLGAFRDHAVLVLQPRGVDYPMDNFQLATMKRNAALIGTTLETMQIRDILRAVDYLVTDEKLPVSGISVYGKRDMGVLAIYAAALDERINRVIVDDPPGSHWRGPALLDILRYTDLPEVAAMIAPREIVSIGSLGSEYKFTNAVYRLYGHSIQEREGLTSALIATSEEAHAK